VRHACFSANGRSDYFAIAKENGYPMELTFCEGARVARRIPESWESSSFVAPPTTSIRDEIVSRLSRLFTTAEAAVAAGVDRKKRNVCTFAIRTCTYISSRIIGTPSMDEIRVMLFKQPTPVHDARCGAAIRSKTHPRDSTIARNRGRWNARAIALRSARWITLYKLRDPGRRRASASARNL